MNSPKGHAKITNVINDSDSNSSHLDPRNSE